MVEKMCHGPADRFQISERGYLREGYFADLAIVNLAEKQMVNKSEVLYHCGWTPLEGENLFAKNVFTFVNGFLAFAHGKILGEPMGAQVSFTRNL
jgi:dihydroorotase